MDSTEFIQYLRQQRLGMDYAITQLVLFWLAVPLTNPAVSAAVILIYDYFLTLHLEIKFIWFSRWKYTEVLFLLVRYMALVGLGFSIYDQVAFNVSVETCKLMLPAREWLAISKIIFAEVILVIRTWAIWRNGRAIGVGLAALALANFAIQCFVANKVSRSMEYAPGPYVGYRGCIITHISNILWVSCASLTVVDTIVLLLIVTSALRAYKTGGHGKLSHVIHRDGILFYVYLLCITIANVTIIFAAPPGVNLILSPLPDVMYSVFTTRIILSIREVGCQDMQTELHTLPLPLELAENPDALTSTTWS